MAYDKTLAQKIEIDVVEKIQEKINENFIVLGEVVDKLVADYCKPLDEYIRYIEDILQDIKNPVTDIELDDFALNLPVLLYFTGEGQEALGIKEDISKAIRMEIYNQVFEATAGTIADKTATAELASQDKYIVNTAYTRAYKKIKLRMELGNEILQSVKKVISRRMAEYEMSRVDSYRIKGGS